MISIKYISDYDEAGKIYSVCINEIGREIPNDIIFPEYGEEYVCELMKYNLDYLALSEEEVNNCMKVFRGIFPIPEKYDTIIVLYGYESRTVYVYVIRLAP